MNLYLGIKSNDESKDESNDVRFIGICGMSGMGQTALAKVVFDKIHNKFDASNFLEDVREASKDTRGLEKLQDQLLHDMKLKCNGDLRKKIQMIRNGLRKKRALIVVVNYAQGIHLVLKVLGSHLCTKSKKEWENTWNQLKAITNEDITKKLQIAFDGLNTYERKLFLDIACFFKGEDQSCGFMMMSSVY